jgi:hypothetical protein
MKMLPIALAISSFMTVGPALALEAPDPELLSPRERVLNMHPQIWPDWTWMREHQADAILRGRGYELVLSIEKSGAYWRGKAIRNNESYQVAVNRYAGISSHLDTKSRALRELLARSPSTTEAPKKKLATLNGLVARSLSQMAPTELTPSRPVSTVMGEVGWTWMKENQAVKLLEKKGYASIHSLRRDHQGIWRAEATKDGLAVNVGIDMYGNTQDQAMGVGGLAQGSSR